MIQSVSAAPVFAPCPWPQFEESREAREGSEGKTKP